MRSVWAAMKERVRRGSRESAPEWTFSVIQRVS